MEDDGFGSDVDAYVEEEQDEEEADLARRRSSRSALAAKADLFLRRHSASIDANSTGDGRPLVSSGGGTEAAAALFGGRALAYGGLPGPAKRVSNSAAGNGAPGASPASAMTQADSKLPAQSEDLESIQFFASRPRVSDASSGSGHFRRADADSVRRDKERLQRFAMEAASFLDKAYENDTSLIVEDDTDVPAPGGRSNDDFRRKRRIELDKARLERFSREAEALIDRAYSDDPAYFVTEEALSPSSSSIPGNMLSRESGVANGRHVNQFALTKDARSSSVMHDKHMLEQFHTQAMSFLDVVAQPNVAGAFLENDADDSSNWMRRNSTRRIQRDKERLEQHYREAMAFLDRAEKGEGIVEERELETGALDRVRLKLYAEEAMAYLESAYAPDSSFDIEGAEYVESPRPGQVAVRMSSNPSRALQSGTDPLAREAAIDALAARALAAREARLAGAGNESLSTTAATADDSATARSDMSDDEEAQIAADRAAMERYYDVDDFGEDAIVEETLSDTSGGTDRGLFARRVGASSSDNAADDDWEGDNVSTDDEYQDNDPSVASSVDGFTIDQHSPVTKGVQRQQPVAQQEPAANKSNTTDVAGNISSSADSRNLRYSRESESPSKDFDKLPATYAERGQVPSVTHGNGEQVLASVAVTPGAGTGGAGKYTGRGADRYISNNRDTVPSVAVADHQFVPLAPDLPAYPAEPDSPPGDEKSTVPRRTSVAFAETPAPCAPNSAQRISEEDVLVELLLESADASERGNEWSEVPLEKSFYRQVPRGATIKIRSRSSRGEEGLSAAAMDSSTPPVSPVHLSQRHYQAELARVEHERDVVMSALEEIVNERSQMAAQISEMKSTIASTFGQGRVTVQSADVGDIDVATELKESYAEFAAIIRESEATVNVLEGHIRENKAKIADLEAQCERHVVEMESLQSQVRAGDQVRAELDASRRALERSATERESWQRRLADADKVLQSEKEDNRKRVEKLQQDLVAFEEHHQKLLNDNEELKGEIENLRLEVEEQSHKAKANSGTSSQTSGNVILWSQLSNARAEAEEARKARDRAERRLQEMKSVVNASTVDTAVEKALERAKNEREKAIELIKSEKDSEISALSSELERIREMQDDSKNLDRNDVRQLRAELNQKNSELQELECKLQTIEFESKTARGFKSRADGEIAELQSALREAQTDQDTKLNSAQQRILELEERIKLQERHLQMQIDDAVGRAAAAEDRAAHARIQLKEMEESAEFALEEERRMRRMIEDQRDALEQETRALAQLGAELDKPHVESAPEFVPAPTAPELVPSSSKRGIRKSSSKAQIGKKKAQGKTSPSTPSDDGSENTGETKRRGHRLRFFG